jgi:hypothetical protein
MSLTKGKKVFVSTSQYSGQGIIQYIDHKEMFGIQVLLDVPDKDGHRIIRVATYEVKPLNDMEPTLKPGERMMATATGKNSSLLDGATYLIEKSTYSKNNNQIHYYNPHTNKLLGGCSSTCFKDIRPVGKDVTKPKSIPKKKVTIIYKTERPKKKKEPKPTKNESLQLSLDLGF